MINQKQQVGEINKSVLKQFQKVITTLETITEEDIYNVISEMKIEKRCKMNMYLNIEKEILTTVPKFGETLILFDFPVGEDTKNNLKDLSGLFLKNIQSIEELIKEILISSKIENFSFITEFIKQSRKNGNLSNLESAYMVFFYLENKIPIKLLSEVELREEFKAFLNFDSKMASVIVASNGQLVDEIHSYQKFFEEQVLEDEIKTIAETLLTDSIQYIASFGLVDEYFEGDFQLQIIESIFSKMIELVNNKKITIRLDCFYKNLRHLKDWNLNSNCKKMLQELFRFILEDNTIPILVGVDSDLPVIVKVLNLIKEFNFNLSDVINSDIELDFDDDDVNEFLYPIPSQEKFYNSETFNVLNTGTINFIINFTGENSPSILSTTEKVLDFGIKFYNQKFGKKIKFKFGETKVLPLLKLLQQEKNILSTETVTEEEVDEIINYILNQTIGS